MCPPSSPPSVPAVLTEHTAVIDQIEGFLREVIEDVQPPAPGPRGRGRDPVLPALCLWAGMIVCVLRGFSAQLDLWRLLTLHGLWRFPMVKVCDQAIYDRLARSDDVPLVTLFVRVSTVLRRRLAPHATARLAPFAREVMALDETVLDTLRRQHESQHDAKHSRQLPGKLAALFDLRRQQWATAQLVDDAREREQLHARDLVARLPRGSLILADLGYFGFAWFDDLSHAGYFWLSRMKVKVSTELIHVIYDGEGMRDSLVWLGAYRSDRAGMPVRLVEITVRGTTHRYLTNVYDHLLLPVGDIPELYARRWDIELAFKLLKRDLKLHLLWSTKTAVLHQQIWASLIIAQVLLALWVEVAGEAKVDPFEVSLSLLVVHAPLLAQAGRDPVRTLADEGRRVGIIRPSRRTQYSAPVVPIEECTPIPPELIVERKARYSRGQGPMPITPAEEVDHQPPPSMPIPPHRRGRGRRPLAAR